jgi:GGDEF domain-containing protein
MADDSGESEPGARTIREADQRPVEDGILHLIVMGADHFSMHPLPEAGVVNIGGDDREEVRLDDPDVARHHARLTIHLGASGAQLEIEDLGRPGGPRVRGEALAPGARAAVLPGEAISIGWATVMIQRRRPVVRLRRLPTHVYFEERLEEECQRAGAIGAAFAVARLHVSADAPSGTAGESVATLLRPGDVLALYGPDEYELLLLEPDRERALGLVARMVAGLSRRQIRARSGVAFYPADGRSADGLIAKACERVQERVTPLAPPAAQKIACGPEMRKVHFLAERAAASNISVLILGETGVGKEVMAEAIHALSARAGRPLVRINCAALSASLIETELFGHERAAFTGASEAKPGLFETADGGTVLLDEIGEFPQVLQSKLLRVIETHQVFRVGAIKPRTIDVRFLAATNRILEDEVARGAFRQDLYYRLNGISLVIPPLRARVDEIAPLARSFLESAARRDGRPVPSLTAEAVALLEAYAWPGNIRELRNDMERALLIAPGREITAADLPLEKLGGTARRSS